MTKLTSIQEAAQEYALKEMARNPHPNDPDFDLMAVYSESFLAGVNSTNHVQGDGSDSGLSAEEILDKHFKSYHDEQFVPKSDKPIKEALICMLKDYRPVPSIPTDLVKRLREENPYRFNSGGQVGEYENRFYKCWDECCDKLSELLNQTK